ncbi:MAG: thioesterase family protein [Sandaracinaceae bacterium]|nr:thioesterase family protein [Sandaracinaceae bacterium]
MTVELLKPVPLAALAVELSVDKRGRSAARLSLRLTHEGIELARATALLLRVREIDAQVAPPSAPPILPDASAPFDFPFFQSDVGYHTAIELRLARGDFGSTPTFMWMRPRHPLVEGEVTTGTQRAVICVDSGNGVSPVLDWRRHGFVNPDVTIALHRPPTGEWIGLDARTDVDPATGLGTAHSCMWDLERPFGYGLQSLLCDPR